MKLGKKNVGKMWSGSQKWTLNYSCQLIECVLYMIEVKMLCCVARITKNWLDFKTISKHVINRWCDSKIF